MKELEHVGFIVMSEGVYVPSKIKIIFDKMELYNFQVKYQRFDNLLKVILRSYGGLFDYFVKVNEFQISRHLKTDKNTVIGLLNELNKLKVIDYSPSSDTPRITFLHARESLEAMYIDPKSIKDRKNRFQVRADAFINYITSTTRCRSMMISSYFGEENLTPCGSCDYCIAKKKEQLHDDEGKKISQFILDQLSNSNLLQIEIYNLSPANYKPKISAAIQKLLETEIVIVDSEEKLSLNKKVK